MRERLRNNDPKVMGVIYDRYGMRCFAIIQRIVVDRQLTEDLVQETFLRVWVRRSLYREDGTSMGAWIAAIARNQAIDYLRSCPGRVQSCGFERNYDRCERAESGSRAYEQSFPSVKLALQKLSDSQRKLLNLVYFQGMSHREVAETLKRPLGTVKTQVRTALSSLRAEMHPNHS